VIDTHTQPFNGPLSGTTRWAGTRKVRPTWILPCQRVSGSGISWAICESAPRSGQITTPAPHHSDFYRPDVLPAAQPTASKHWGLSTEAIDKQCETCIFAQCTLFPAYLAVSCLIVCFCADELDSKRMSLTTKSRYSLAENSLKVCEDLVTELMRQDDAWPFLKPVTKKEVLWNFFKSYIRHQHCFTFAFHHNRKYLSYRTVTAWNRTDSESCLLIIM